MKYLGICAIIKDETPFIEEWIAYHSLVGVERFFLYDNGSTVPLSQTLAKHISSNYLIIHDVPGRALQMKCYNHCLSMYGKECEWMAFIDADEFIVPKKTTDLRPMLAEFEKCAGLAAAWRRFGSNGHLRRPEGLQIENYTRALNDNDRTYEIVKLIVKPRKAHYFYNPHVCILRDKNSHITDEKHRPVISFFASPFSRDTCQINHYHYRSKQDYYQKLRRPMADSLRRHAIPQKIQIPEGDCEDLSAARFAPMVRRMLQNQEDHSWKKISRHIIVSETPARCIERVYGLLCEGAVTDALILLVKANLCFRGHPELSLLLQKSLPLIQ